MEGNIVGANQRHGIVVRGGSDMVRNRVRGNSVGTLPPPLEGADQGNEGYGLWLLSGGNAIGGETDTEQNVIAFNGLHGVRVSGSFAWSNLLRRNSIYGVPSGSLGDLDVVANGADPSDDSFGGDRVQSAQTYAQWQQNTLVLGAAGYTPGSGANSAGWTLQSGANGQYRIEFYMNEDNASGGKVFLGEQAATTDAAGFASGTASLSPATPMDTRGNYITATVTDLKPTRRPTHPQQTGCEGAVAPAAGLPCLQIPRGDPIADTRLTHPRH